VASNVESAKSACLQPGIIGACIQVSILIMFYVKKSACLDILFFLPWGGGWDAVSTKTVRHGEGSFVPNRLINPGPVCMLHIDFKCLVICARFLIPSCKD